MVLVTLIENKYEREQDAGTPIRKHVISVPNGQVVQVVEGELIIYGADGVVPLREFRPDQWDQAIIHSSGFDEHLRRMPRTPLIQELDKKLADAGG